LAKVLNADLDDLLLLADKMSDDIREQVKKWPDAFHKIARLDDRPLDSLLAQNCWRKLRVVSLERRGVAN
jgi:hypothetical protein